MKMRIIDSVTFLTNCDFSIRSWRAQGYWLSRWSVGNDPLSPVRAPTYPIVCISSYRLPCMIALLVLHIAKLLVYGDRQKKKTTLAPYKIS